ncbi:MAG: hypothetical protein EBZ05_09995 [Verrucomicrobia bacterium]|nr:hypothetical protein [Verrucomicrobiota bacterium]
MRSALARFVVAMATAGWTQDFTKIYPTYSSTIIRISFPDYVPEKRTDGRLIAHSTHSNTIFRKPFGPEAHLA